MPRILIADDSQLNAELLEVHLEGTGFETMIATNGEETLSAARDWKPDVILLDVMMPNLDGLSACAAIRAQPETADIPIIMVTTRGEEHSIETAFRNGCTDYVTKPINGLELLTKLYNILGFASHKETA